MAGLLVGCAALGLLVGAVRRKKECVHAEKPKVIVIGAGISGLTCASILKRSGVDVMVIEGRDRLGGRTFTYELDKGIFVDCGAQWIHGVNGNPLIPLCRNLGVPVTADTGDRADIFDYDGSYVSEDEMAEAQESWDDCWERVKGYIETLRKEGKGWDLSLHDGIAHATSRPEWAMEQDSTTRQGRLVQLIQTGQEQYEACKLNALSLMGTPQHEDLSGGFGGADYQLSDGYGPLIRALAAGVDVRLSEAVVAIEDYASRRVRVVTDRGSHEAAAVVTTIPLGVLKTGTVAFRPPLPEWKSGAIGRIGMGLYNKIILMFPEQFWAEDICCLEYASKERGAWRFFWNNTFVSHVPILGASLVADVARARELLSDEEVVAEAMAVLRLMYPNAPDPVKVKVTRWSQDVFARGSYSHAAVGSREGDFVAMSRPTGRLVWAGEATSPEFFATAHGAYLSGQRAAKEVALLTGCTLADIGPTCTRY